MLGVNQKPWVSSFIAIMFIVVSVSGLFLLYHLKSPGIHQLHQWGGILFIAGGICHLVLNWRIFVSYFKNARMVWGSITGVVVLALLISLFPLSNHGEGGNSYRHGKGRPYYGEMYHR